MKRSIIDFFVLNFYNYKSKYFQKNDNNIFTNGKICDKILNMKMLGIDYGDRYVGFAAWDSEEILAYPLDTVKVKSMREAISTAESILQKDKYERIVLGLPLMPDGKEGERASKTRAFGRVLEKVSGIEVVYYDERLTTVQAEEYLSMCGIKKIDMKKYTDKVSAQIILSDYIEARKCGGVKNENQ